MDRSFLELLEAEKRAFNDMKWFNKSADDFLDKVNKECDIKGRVCCMRIASDYRDKASKAEEELLQIRKEMKQYISFLEAL